MQGQRRLRAITLAANNYVGPGGHWMKSKIKNGRCRECRSRIEKCEWIWWDTLASRVLCVDCRRVEDPSDQPPTKVGSSGSGRAPRGSASTRPLQERTPRLIKKLGASAEPKLLARNQCPEPLPTSNGGYVGFFDGACEGNPGPIGIGATLLKGGATIDSISMNCGAGTNNVAEWKALIALLELAIKHSVSELEVYGDSQLIINQINGEYRVKAKNLRPYKTRAAELIEQIGTAQFMWIPRENNHLADELSKACL